MALDTGANIIGNIGTIMSGTINSGSLVVTAGTIATGTIQAVNTLGTLPNIPGGTITSLQGGTVQTNMLSGTLNLGTVIPNGGTINNIAGGTINMLGTIKDNYSSIGTFTITVGTLATSSAGVGRQSNLLDNSANLYSSALLTARITAGTVTTANNLISFYLIRGDGTSFDDNAGTGDAGWTQANAPLLYNMVINAVGTNVTWKAAFDTGNYILGTNWGIGVVHNLGNPLNPTAGSHSITYFGYTKKNA